MLTEPSVCVAVQSVPGPGTSQSGQTATVSADTSTSDRPTTTGTHEPSSNQSAATETSGPWTISDSSGASSASENSASSPRASDSAQLSLAPIIINGLFVVLPQCLTQRCGLVQVSAGEHNLVIEAEDQGCLWTRSFLSLNCAVTLPALPVAVHW